MRFLDTHPEQEPNSAVMVVGDTRNLAENLRKNPAVPNVISRNTEPVLRSRDIKFSRNTQLKPKPLSETTDVFRSLSSNFMPSGDEKIRCIRVSLFSKILIIYEVIYTINIPLLTIFFFI